MARDRGWRRLLAAFVAGLVVLPLVGLVLGLAGHLPVRASDPPPAWAAGLAHHFLEARLAREARGLRNPLNPDDAAVLAQGLRLYRRNCSGCHGRPGAPSPWGTTSFHPRVPQLADAGSRLSAPEMFVVVKHGIRLSGMGAWGGNLKDEEIWTVVTFLQRIRSLPPEVVDLWDRN